MKSFSKLRMQFIGLTKLKRISVSIVLLNRIRKRTFNIFKFIFCISHFLDIDVILQGRTTHFKTVRDYRKRIRYLYFCIAIDLNKILIPRTKRINDKILILFLKKMPFQMLYTKRYINDYVNMNLNKKNISTYHRRYDSYLAKYKVNNLFTKNALIRSYAI